MYSPIENIAETTAPQERKLGGAPLVIRLLTATVWIGMWLFGTFAAGHYIRNAFMGRWDWWELTDPGLFRPSYPAANLLMLAHLCGGTILMAAGPIQLIPAVRRKFLRLHRWIGRAYIFSALVAAVGASLFVLLYGTSRGSKVEDVANVCFGTSMSVCAVETYRHAAWTKKIEVHQKWSWRLFALVLGALLYRLYIVVYFAFVIYTPWEGSMLIYNAIFFLFFMPNLIVVELLWHDSRRWEKVALIWTAALFVAVTTTVVSMFSWLPALQGIATTQGDLLADYDEMSE